MSTFVRKVNDSSPLSFTDPAITRADYSFYSAGNGQPGPGVADIPVVKQTAPTLGVPASGYRSLRDTDNTYFIAYGRRIEWSANQIKINLNLNNKSYLIGTDGNDRLFGQLGDDPLRGGEGDDILVGFTGANDAKQRLNDCDFC